MKQLIARIILKSKLALQFLHSLFIKPFALYAIRYMKRTKSLYLYRVTTFELCNVPLYKQSVKLDMGVMFERSLMLVGGVLTAAYIVMGILLGYASIAGVYLENLIK